MVNSTIRGGTGTLSKKEYNRWDRLSHETGTWTVIAIHPPHGKRQSFAYTLLSDDDGWTIWRTHRELHDEDFAYLPDDSVDNT